jgi:cystathionine gamma-lyase
MAAANAVMNLLKAGDHVVAGNDLYGGTYRLFTKVYAQYGLTFTFVDATQPERVEEAFRPETRLLWIESPTNPLLRIVDLKAMAALTRKRNYLLAVDNTFASPFLQHPLEMGADLVVHSTTKYLGGHCDLVGGALVTNREDLKERLAFYQNAVGAVPGPMDCWLVLRGTKTLALRMERHCANALAVARFLEGHPGVEKVYYPGLSSHPQYLLAKAQMKDFGGMVSFQVRGGPERAKKLVSRTKVFALAESLGGVESLIEHPPSMTHGSIPEEERRAAGLADNLVRLSVGIEHSDDLLADLSQALEKA